MTGGIFLISSSAEHAARWSIFRDIQKRPPLLLAGRVYEVLDFIRR